MTTPRRSIVVTRDYCPAPNDCARALGLVLKKPVSKEGGPETAPDNEAKEFKHDCPVNQHST
jgi:hypothetical protein